MASQEGQNIIKQFFEALLSNDVDRCENLSHNMLILSRADSNDRPWAEYFTGILAEVRDDDWTLAGAIYHKLLDNIDLELFLRGQILLSLSNVYLRQGLWQNVINSAKDGEVIFDKLNEPTEQVKAWLRISNGYTEGYQQGAFDQSVLAKAVSYGKLALNRLAELKPTDDPKSIMNYYVARIALGNAAMGLNEWRDAVNNFVLSLEFAQQLGNNFMMLFPYANLADAYVGLGYEYLEKAIDSSKSALYIAQDCGIQYYEFWLYGQLGFLHKMANAYTLSIDYYDHGFELIDEVRASLADAHAKADFIATVTEEYANAVLTCIEAGDPEKAFHYTEQARARIFLELLESAQNPLDDSTTISPTDYQSLKALLPPDFMILSYYTTGVIESSLARQERNNGYRRVRFPEEKILIFAITKDDIQVFDSGLNPNQIYPDNLESAVQHYFLRSGMRKYLHSHLIKPVQHLLEGKKRVAICPHGPLHYVPFQALINDEGTPLLTAEGPEIVYAPSVTVLIRELAREKMPNGVETPAGASLDAPVEAQVEASLTNGCLTVGFDGVSNKETGVTVEGLGRLEHAETEAKVIAKITGGESLVGATPKKDELFAKAPAYLYLHFSCHGDFRPDDPMESTLYIGPTETLTAGEVIDMPRLNCRLVTLSACETGRQQVKRGDELYGFARSFFQAGAKAVMATMWNVDERTTRIFAEKFVYRLRDGADVSTAMKDAQLYLRSLTKAEIKEHLTRFSEETGYQRIIGAESASAEEANHVSSLEPNAVPSLETLLDDTDEDDAVFSDNPFYWAPYLLIGDPDLG